MNDDAGLKRILSGPSGLPKGRHGRKMIVATNVEIWVTQKKESVNGKVNG